MMGRLQGYALAGMVGLTTTLALPALVTFGQVGLDLASGYKTDCDLLATLNTRRASVRFQELLEEQRRASRIVAQDPALGLIQVHTRERDFWTPAGGDGMDGARLIPYLMAEHEMMWEANPTLQVRPGEVVVDVGGHVGTYTHLALRLGAAKVVALEINPLNLECLRRNFRKEIEQGRVIVQPRGAWSSETSMTFHLPRSNSGMGSLVLEEQEARRIQVPLARIDTIVAELGLRRVDFLKLDIEGAEREALAGARETLGRFQPRLSIDAYHLPDDPVVLPRIILAANPKYVAECGVCELNGRRFQPHVLYYH